MSKRFIDTELFDDPWFMDLSISAKILWIYCITKCDHAGILEMNKRLTKFQTGIKNIETVIKELGNRLVTVSEQYIFIPKFIEFQYPNFPQSAVRQQASAIKRLIDFNLFDVEKQTVIKELTNSYEHGTVNEPVIENDNEHESEPDIVYPFDSDEFKKWWGYWKEYKRKEFKFRYASSISEQSTLKELSGLAGGNEETAIKIIEQSMAKNWKGLFELQQNQTLNPAAREELRKQVAKKYFGS